MTSWFLFLSILEKRCNIVYFFCIIYVYDKLTYRQQEIFAISKSNFVDFSYLYVNKEKKSEALIMSFLLPFLPLTPYFKR